MCTKYVQVFLPTLIIIACLSKKFNYKFRIAKKITHCHNWRWVILYVFAKLEVRPQGSIVRHGGMRASTR